MLPICLLLNALCLLAPEQVSTHQATLPLWQQAVQAFESSSRLLPGRMHLLVEELSSKGEVTHRMEQERLIIPPTSTGAKASSRLVWARKDGTDHTAELRSQEENPKKGGGRGQQISLLAHEESPLARIRQQEVSLTPRTGQRLVSGIACQGFDFTLPARPDQKDRKSLKGTVWIDSDRGLPLELSYTQTPLPPHVKAQTTTQTFRRGPAGAWVTDTVSIEGHAGFLFFRKRYRIHFTLSDYQMLPGKEQDPPPGPGGTPALSTPSRSFCTETSKSNLP